MAYALCGGIVRGYARQGLVWSVTCVAMASTLAPWASAELLPRRRAGRSNTYCVPNKPSRANHVVSPPTVDTPGEIVGPPLQPEAVAASVIQPPVAAMPARAADEPGFQQLFDGTSLAGWRANENQDSWRVADGRIVCHGPRSHLFYVGPDAAKPADFTNFHFKADVMTKPGANSGIFFHTAFQPEGWPAQGYEMQVNNSQKDPVRTGSIYNVVKNFIPPAADNEWFTEEVIVKGKAVTVLVNGRVLFEYVEPEGVTGTRKLSHGTFALQAHDPGSEVHYKNIRVKPLP